MSPVTPTSAPRDRVHLVLVPGFAGFDALGHLEYYANITPLFRDWCNGQQDDHPGMMRPEPAQERAPRPVLHYFDNFPTAGVVTRAWRLRAYLAKRIARGEFSPHDEVVLVGHSTGGLDIRCLLWRLAREQSVTAVDGGHDRAVEVEADEILDMVKRVVFLSVPHWGTNLADWVAARAIGRTFVIANLRAAVAASQVPLLDVVEGVMAGGASDLTGLELVHAMQDVLAEARAPLCADKIRTAGAHQCASEVELWLRHMAWDFDAIDDLKAEPKGDGSPAHFSIEDRADEIRLLNGRRVCTRSYVTIGKRPEGVYDSDDAAWCLPETSGDDRPGSTAQASAAEQDIVYRTCYRACASGPFAPPPAAPALRCLTDEHERLVREWTGGRITAWDNDGIVNTASMVWRAGEDAVLVPSDHMDIVGHYAACPASGESGRTRQAYDLLGSASGFDHETFGAVWRDVFAWACGGGVRAMTAHP